MTVDLRHRFDQLHIDHQGYAKTVVNKRSKARRNLDIAEAQHHNDDDARSAIHLARSLSYAGEAPERALELLELSLTEAEDPAPTTRAQILGLLADRCWELDQTQCAFDLAKQALTLLPVDDTAAAIHSNATRNSSAGHRDHK